MHFRVGRETHKATHADHPGTETTSHVDGDYIMPRPSGWHEERAFSVLEVT